MTILPIGLRSLVALTLVPAFALHAQRPARRVDETVVPLRTHWYETSAVAVIVPDKLNAMTAEWTSDGWVVVTPARPGDDPGDSYPTRRMYLTPAEVLRWSGAVRQMLARPLDTLGTLDSAAIRFPLLGRGDASIEGSRLARGSRANTPNFVLELCRYSFFAHDVADSTFRQIADVLERAATAARAVRASPRPPTLDRPYYANEVGCPAKPRADNAPPLYPPLRDGVPRTAHDVGVRFVVDTNGLVEPRSVTVLPGTPAAFAAAARATVARWRYTPARWGSAPVRQVVHVTLAFDPDARPNREVRFTSLGNRDEPRVLFEPTSDGWVRVTHAERDLNGHLSGAREWFAPDSMRVWLGRVERQLDEDAAAPKIWRVGASFIGPGIAYQTGPSFLVAMYPMVRVARDSVSPPDSIQRMRVQLSGCYGGRYFFGELVDSALLARARQATGAAIRLRATPAPIAGRVYDRNEVACPARITPAELHDPRVPGAQRHRLGPYPASMHEANARAEVMASFVVDSTGRVERGSLVVMRGSDWRAVAALRAGISAYDFAPATRSGVHVRQRVIRTWVFVPPIRCENEEQGLECPRGYGPNVR